LEIAGARLTKGHVALHQSAVGIIAAVLLLPWALCICAQCELF